MRPNYDVFIDEEKNQGYLGFLVTKNTPALQQILFNVRESHQNYRREIKFVSLSNNSIHVALSWINIFYKNDHNAIFIYRKWNGSITNKKNLIIKTLTQIDKYFRAKGNLVCFMDFDSNHKNLNLQNQVTSQAKITRCYHLDSKCFDMLQLCDILLQCAIKAEMNIEFSSEDYHFLTSKMRKLEMLEKSKLKKLLVLDSMNQNLHRHKIRKKLAA